MWSLLRPLTQHCCHNPGVELIGRQCHIHPDANLSAPVCCVLNPYFERVVSFLVASFSNVVMMSVAKQTQSSPVSRYGACTLHSAQAPALVGSGCPAPFGPLERWPKRRTASVLTRDARRARAATFIACITNELTSSSLSSITD